VSFIHELEPRWVILAACMLLPAGLAGGTLWIQWRNWRTRRWHQTQGRIESARSVAREVRSRQIRTAGTERNTEFVTSESLRTRNFAEVSYSFAVGANTYRSQRICPIGEPDGSVSAVLKRYPQGRIVTVYYNPKDPNECILERDAPARICEAWLGTGVLAALILGCFFAITEGADWLATVVPHPTRVPAMMMLMVISLVVLMIVRALTKQTRAMKKWPTTAGRIIRSEVAMTVQHHRRPSRIRGDYNVTMYVPRIVYAYEADGHSFEGDDIGWSTSANQRSVAEKYVKRYPLQSPVRVYYNPDDPAEATLSPSVGMLVWILWVVAGAIAFAAFAAGWLVP
jgi:hypothetical protein